MILLTDETIRQLPEGTPIMVKWSGGNGPHPYKLGFIHGQMPHAVMKITGNNYNIGFLDGIGKHPLTQVFVDEKYYTE